MRDWDPTIVVALISAIGIVISGGFGVLVAVLTNRKESQGSAEKAADTAADRAAEEKEEVLRERILLRDEEIARLKLMVVDLNADNERLRRNARNTDD